MSGGLGTPRRFFRTAVLWLIGPAAVVLPAAGAEAADAARRSVLLMIGDDHGLDAGCYGNPRIRTPHLDRLAREGVRFANAFATVSSCSPSRSVILTGLHTHQNGQYGLQHAEHKQSTHPWVRSLPGLLREAGYRTGIIGKYHLGPDEVYPFEERPSGPFQGARNVAAMAAAARRFFETSPDRPFFLLVGFTDSHRARTGFANETTYDGVVETRYGAGDVVVPPFLPDRPEVREELAEYYQSVSRLDQGVGMVREALRQSGREAETLVIYLSDNGMPFPGAKTTLYDSGIHLPLLVWAPGLKRPGLVSQAMVSWTDIAPTVIEWTGVTAPKYRLAGRSLLPVLGEENPPGWDVVFASHQFHEITMYYPMRAVRTRTHKYILNLAYPLPYPHASDLFDSRTWQGILERRDVLMGVRPVSQFLQRPREELYDVVRDPAESRNLAGDPSVRTVLDSCRDRLRRFQEETGDPWVVKYRHE